MDQSFRLKPLAAAILTLRRPTFTTAQFATRSLLSCAAWAPLYANAQTVNMPDKMLPQIEVRAQQEVAPDGYLGTATRVGKILQDPHDIPQAVTTITNQIMQEQQVGSLHEALRNVSGLTFNAAEGGRSGDNMMLRGFYTFGDIYLDGIRDTAQYNRETFNLEQVDVLRGSAAMLFGRGQAGGVINQVSKAPLLADQYKASASLGTQSYREITSDFNKKLDGNNALRVNIMNRDEGSQRVNPSNGDQAELHRQGIAFSLGLGIGLEDEFNLSHVTTKTRDVPDYGVAFDSSTHRPSSNFSATTYWGTSANFDDSATNISSVSHIHRFDNDTELRTHLRSANYQRSYWAKTPSATLAPSPLAGTGGNQTRDGDYQTTTLQSDFTTKFNAWGMPHEFLTGVEYLHEDSYRRTLTNQGTTVAPVYFASVSSNAPATFKGDSYAAYVQDAVEFIPHWKVLLGARRDELKSSYSSTASPQLKFGENSWRSGLSWQPNVDAHYYFSWSDSFSPTADLYQLSGSSYPAERSKVLELGAKWLLLEGDLALRTALYRANKNWERNNDLESTTAAILTKKRHTDGFEIEVAGRINKNWELFSGLALMDAKIDEVAENLTGNADPRFQGQAARNTPNYTFNLWTTYKLGGGWKLGGGVEAKGKRYGYNPSNTVTQTNASGLFASGSFTPNTAPGYARYDAMLSYEQKNWTLRLNMRNLFDTVYYDALYDNGAFTVPGTRRSLIATLETKF